MRGPARSNPRRSGGVTANVWRAMVFACAASCATSNEDLVPAPEDPRLKLVGVALNEASVVRVGCPDVACPPERPICAGASAVHDACGGAKAVPCSECGFLEVQQPGDCGNCACTLDCRVPFTSKGDERCDWRDGRWRDANCREGRACAASEVCADDGRCVAAVCATDLDCARGDVCSNGRCAVVRPGICVADVRRPPPPP